jgi:hypothetical protein
MSIFMASLPVPIAPNSPAILARRGLNTFHRARVLPAQLAALDAEEVAVEAWPLTL